MESKEKISEEEIQKIIKDVDERLSAINDVSSSDTEEGSARIQYIIDRLGKYLPPNQVEDLKRQVGLWKKQEAMNAEAARNIEEVTGKLDEVSQTLDMVERVPAGDPGAFPTEDLQNILFATENIASDIVYIGGMMAEMAAQAKEIAALAKINTAMCAEASGLSAAAGGISAAAAIIDAIKLPPMVTGLAIAPGGLTAASGSVISEAAGVLGVSAGVAAHVSANTTKVAAFCSLIAANALFISLSVQHGAAVLATPPVPFIPLPVCGWDIIDPYYWVAGVIEAEIIEEPLIKVSSEAPPPVIVQGVNETPVINEYIIDEEVKIPKIGFDGGGTVF